jgi:hypothetical protein
MKRTVVLCAILASASLVLISACSRESVERETSREVISPMPPASPTPNMIVRQPPPPPRQEVRAASPAPEYVWVPGYWLWDHGWVWVQGRWERPPERMATWVPGHWAQQGTAWVWRPGRWQ